MKKALFITLGTIVALFLLVYAFIYFVPYSQGYRSGELIKFSNKGVLVKTWEGEISQGMSGAQIFSFSVLDKEEKVIQQLKDFQGRYVKVTYVERFATFFGWATRNISLPKYRKSNPHILETKWN